MNLALLARHCVIEYAIKILIPFQPSKRWSALHHKICHSVTISIIKNRRGSSDLLKDPVGISIVVGSEKTMSHDTHFRRFRRRILD